MDFTAIINLRQPTEPGADMEAEAAAARTASINFFNIPLNHATPDADAVDRFLQTIAQSGNQPAFIHCASGNRGAGMGLVKGVLVDKWDLERVGAEEASLGLSHATLKAFMVNYIGSHKK
jgi:protein tyrosine phosphatase (PTP) superfamily phosphohydrolase (DUF442 family)